MKIVLQILTATLITLTALLGVHDAALAKSVYHTVKANGKDGKHVVNWTKDSFGVSGGPPTLSFFEFASDEAAIEAAKKNALDRPLDAAKYACQIKVELQDLPAGEIVKNSAAKIGKDAFTVEGTYPKATATPWTIVFDQEDFDNHWGLYKANFTKNDASNNEASNIAAATFKALTDNEHQGVTVIDGNESNCKAQ